MPYDRQPNPLDGLRNMVFRGATPFTNTLLLISLVLLILGYAAPLTVGPLMQNNLIADLSNALSRPWSLVLYPLMPMNPLSQLIWGLWMWQFGGSLERSWGTGRYAVFFLALSLVSSLSVLLGGFILKLDPQLSSFLLPLAGILIAFCALNPGTPINFFIISVPTRWVMAIVFALVWFMMGNAFLGVFAEAGPLAALWYINHGRSWGSISHHTQRSRGDIIDFQAARKRKSNAVYLDGSLHRSPLDFAGRWRDRQERKRLERLLRNSGLSDPDERRDERR